MSIFEDPGFRATWFQPFHAMQIVAGVVASIFAIFPASGAHAQTRAQFDAARKMMVRDAIKGSGVRDPRVLKAMEQTHRHEFVPRVLRKKAYYDMALPIGDKQTISSPFIVAYMTESLKTKPTDRVLEIGTGSGYQAAVLSPLVKDVYSIEIVKPLGENAAKLLKRLGYENIHTKIGDGFKGWPEHAPFDKIIVTCSPEDVPKPLVEQLAEGGRLVIPVGERYQQTLYLYTKVKGKLKADPLLPTLFVPMTGAAEDVRKVKPDPLQPKAVNGDFEEPVAKGTEKHVPGWYYKRQAVLVPADGEGKGNIVRFKNSTPGRPSILLQGFAVDGEKVGWLQLSTKVKLERIKEGHNKSMTPRIAVTFYDDVRRDLGTSWIGPWKSTDGWQSETGRIRVPERAKHGILRVGLFGATGTGEFDDVTMKAVER